MFKKTFFCIYLLILPLLLIGFLWHNHRLSKLEYKSVDFTTNFFFLRNTEELARLNFFTAKYSFYLATTLDMGVHFTTLTEEQRISILDKKWNNFLERLTDITKDDRTYIARDIISKDMEIHREAKRFNRTLNLIKKYPDALPHAYKLFFGEKPKEKQKNNTKEDRQITNIK